MRIRIPKKQNWSFLKSSFKQLQSYFVAQKQNLWQHTGSTFEASESEIIPPKEVTKTYMPSLSGWTSTQQAYLVTQVCHVKMLRSPM